MLIYMAIPVLIIIGLCLFSYMAGRYVRVGKKREEVKAPEMIAAPESPKEPDRAPILEEEIRNLKEALEIKNKELEERNKAAELIMRENQELLDRIRQENTDKINKQTEEAEETIRLKARLSQLEKELAANNVAAQPVLLSYEDAPKEPEEKASRKKPKKKVKRKK